MGQVGSTGELTQEGIKQIRDVKESDVMMNLIFRYMLKQINVTDFMKLSQPDTCKEYVISLAEHMSSQFSHLQITPYREKQSDVLLFTKYGELDPSKKSETHSEEEKKSLCLLLSYYYTRIFQIYGALAITLLNDISSSQSVTQLSTGLDRSLNKTKGYTQVSAASLMGGAQGGADMAEMKESSFVFLSSYFKNKEDKDTYQLKKGWHMKYDEGNINGGRVYFDKIESIKSESSVVTDIGRFIIYPPATRDRYLILEVSSKWAKGTVYDTLLEYKSLKTSDSPPTTISIPASLKVPVTITRKSNTNVSSYLVKVKRTNGEAVTDVPTYFDKVFQELIAAFPSKGKTTSDTSDDTLNEENVSNPLKIGIIKKALEERRTAGHCIARALQLLRTIPSTIPNGAASYESDICIENFTFTSKSHKGIVSTSTTPRLRGIPESGESLLKDNSAGSRGFHPLVQLFYDTIHIGSPQIVMGDTAFTEYKAFMAKMANLYWDDVPQATPGMGMLKGLAEIRNKRDDAMCSKELGKTVGVIKINPAIVKVDEVSRVVRELFTIQMNHAKKCGEIFKLLFDIPYDEKRNPLTISLNKTLLQGGFKELRRINGLARNVLIDYYSMCEQKYVQGVNMIVSPMRAASAAANAARAAASAPSNPTLPLGRSVSDGASPPLPLRRSASDGIPPAAIAPRAMGASGPLLSNPFPQKAMGAPSAPRAPIAPRAPKALGPSKKGGTRKRHVIRQ